MSRGLRITRVRIYQYRTQTRDLGVDYNGFNSVYEPGVQREGQGYVIAIETDQGITGEYAGGDAPTYAQVGLFARYLLGRDALQRELIYNDVKRALRKQDRMGLGPVDIALWDIAGKVHQAPIWQLLGGWKTRLPAYASTYHGDENGGLDSPEAFADFARAVPGAGLSRLQDPRLGARPDRPGGGDRAGGPPAGRPGDGFDARRGTGGGMATGVGQFRFGRRGASGR
jgi:L-alanine-DL-glutamate epimerase-like enolase superfamily enzyme